MKLINIKKIGDDWGGDNLLFTIHITEKRYIKALKSLGYKLDDILWDINREQELEFQWGYEVSYDNVDYNGYFFKTVYIDKDNLSHKIDKDKVVITNEFIVALIIDSCNELMEKLLIKYQGILWSKIDYENDIYEQFLDTECVSFSELCCLESLADGEIDIKEFANRQGYEWEEITMNNQERIKEIRELIDEFAKNDQYSVNNPYVKALYKELRELEGREPVKEETYETPFIDGSDVTGYYYE